MMTFFSKAHIIKTVRIRAEVGVPVGAFSRITFWNEIAFPLQDEKKNVHKDTFLPNP